MKSYSLVFHFIVAGASLNPSKDRINYKLIFKDEKIESVFLKIQ